MKPLSPSETEILQWLADGKSALDIATIRGTAYSTVKAQIVRLRAKLEADTAPQAVATGIRQGIIH